MHIGTPVYVPSTAYLYMYIVLCPATAVMLLLTQPEGGPVQNVRVPARAVLCRYIVVAAVQPHGDQPLSRPITFSFLHTTHAHTHAPSTHQPDRSQMRLVWFGGSMVHRLMDTAIRMYLSYLVRVYNRQSIDELATRRNLPRRVNA